MQDFSIDEFFREGDMFVKVKNGDGTYYCAPTSKYEYAYKSVDEIDTTEKLTAWHKSLDTDNDIDGVGSKFLSVCLKSKEPRNTEKLPYGPYRYYEETSSKPSRLVPTTYRSEENYIKLPELDKIKADLKIFLDSKDIYDELKFTYRRGYLLHGPPGNGKTALIRSLVNDMNLNAHIIWLDRIPSPSIIRCLDKVEGTKICIFEEIINQNNQINFDMADFLSFMDGETSISNCVTIATTNYPEELGANLADRPSRFDVVVPINNPSDASFYKFISSLLKTDITEKDLKNKKFSFAQAKEIVLLHKMHKISLEDAAKRMKDQSEQFKAGFEEKKAFGL